jgi:hypothetical protein
MNGQGQAYIQMMPVTFVPVFQIQMQGPAHPHKENGAGDSGKSRRGCDSGNWGKCAKNAALGAEAQQTSLKDDEREAVPRSRNEMGTWTSCGAGGLWNTSSIIGDVDSDGWASQSLSRPLSGTLQKGGARDTCISTTSSGECADQDGGTDDPQGSARESTGAGSRSSSTSSSSRQVASSSGDPSIDTATVEHFGSTSSAQSASFETAMSSQRSEKSCRSTDSRGCWCARMAEDRLRVEPAFTYARGRVLRELQRPRPTDPTTSSGPWKHSEGNWASIVTLNIDPPRRVPPRKKATDGRGSAN